MATYRYAHDPPPTGPFIRLLDLLPSLDRDAPIELHVGIYHLDDAPAYEALSYAWGPPYPKEYVWCSNRPLPAFDASNEPHYPWQTDLLNFSEPYPTFEPYEYSPWAHDYNSYPGSGMATTPQYLPRTPIRIGDNLYHGLKHLRKQDEPRCLWIDAICINQSSPEEKNHQIPLMRQIYQNAECVLVWLGKSADNSDLAMDYLYKLQSTSCLEELITLPYGATPEHFGLKGERAIFQVTTIQTFNVSHSGIALPIPDATDPTWESLQTLMRRPWFSRIWVLQEVAVARKTLIVCGNNTVSWGFHRKIPEALDFRLGNELLGPRWKLFHLIDECRRATALPDLLYLTLGYESSQPRDRIYALLGLIGGQSESADAVDYNIPVDHLYQEVTKFCMQEKPTWVPFWLSLASKRGKLIQGLPSWTIDWSMPWYPDNLWDGYTRSRPEYNETPSWSFSLAGCSFDGQLKLSGRRYDILRHIGMTTWETSQGQADLRAAIVNWADFARQAIPISETEIKHDTFIQTLFHALYREDPASDNIVRIHATLRWFLNEAEKYSPADIPISGDIYQKISDATLGQRMCITHRGTLSICPANTEEDDIIVKFGDYHTHFVLRESGDYYVLIGPCYVDGESVRSGQEDFTLK